MPAVWTRRTDGLWTLQLDVIANTMDKTMVICAYSQQSQPATATTDAGAEDEPETK